ncbi:CREB-regulated transcription coactivator 1 [Orchesella cincta]|uniref:CREB-regulated transcription coactivator 1 n=1 Tax=Orchesella cincta TaxID=48709 RepID=A0A1D2M9P6_ORCCI|nr:CREB-regulated transcription coactivator 1 [Orchesella cincta]
MLTAYRCPPRPSPQNSPSPFRPASPHDGLSAPPSPSAQPQSADSFYLSQQANALQQHFEQISMVDGTPQRNNNGHWQQGGAMANSGFYVYNNGQQQQIGATAGVTTQQSPSHHQPQTPQTPSSIPDIIFTEFLGSDCTDPLEDFLTSEAAAQAFREGLGPIDTGDFRMLDDPNLVLPDPQAEDAFRLDRL